MNKGLLWLLMPLWFWGCSQETEEPIAPIEEVVVMEESAAPLPEPVYSGTVLYFQEGEQGIEPYITRMMITPTFLRMDYGNTDEGFLLLDRRTNELMNVNPMDRSVLRMKRREVTSRPAEGFQQSSETYVDDTAPLIGGIQPEQHLFYANEQECYGTVSVPGLLEDERLALENFVLTLAGEQDQNLDNTPMEMREDCMMTNLIYSPTQHLQHGFPIQEWSYNGYSRVLVNFESDQVFDEALFDVPLEYREYALSD